jgi:hypothetical protein
MQYKESKKYLLVLKEKISEYTGEDKVDAFINNTIKEYERIEPLAICYKQSLNKNNYKHAVFGLAIYRTLLGDIGYEKDEALKILGEILNYYSAKSIEDSKIKQYMLSKMSKFSFIKKSVNKKMYSLTEPNGWKMKRCDSDAYWAFDVHRCGLYNWLKEQGAEEICTAFCEVDYVNASYMTGLRLDRTKTIAGGDDICDFRYRKVKG